MSAGPAAAATRPSPGRAGAAALALALAVLVPVRSLDQLRYAASFALAAAVMWLWGCAASRRLLGGAPGPCTAVFVGQLALLAWGAAASALDRLAATAFGRAPPLVLVVVASTAVLAALELRRGRPEGAGPAPRLLPLAAAAGSALVVAIYSRHVSALGLDTHEHTAWVEQILRLGHVPVLEPSTRVVGEYPRSFHLLTAMWAAAGLAPPSGPFVKAMPFLQNALVVLAAAEAAIALAARASDGAARRVDVAVALGWWCWMFFLVPAVYPSYDLSGTPRFASNAVVLAPAVLVLAAAARGERGLRVALALSPLLAAWAATWNPISIVQLAFAGAPLALALAVAARRVVVRSAATRGVGSVAAASCALAVLVAAQDPWMVGQAARRAPGAAALLRRAGLATHDQAVAAGGASARDFAVHQRAPSPPCRDVRCVAAVVRRSAEAALRLPLAGARSGWRDLASLARGPSLERIRDALRGAAPMQPAPFSDRAALAAFALVVAGAVAAALGAARGAREGGAPAPSGPGRLLVGSAAGVAVAGVGLAFAAAVAAGLDDGSHPARILVDYLGFGPFHVGLAALGIPHVLACAALGAVGAASPRRDLSAHAPGTRAVIAVVAVAALSLATRPNLRRAVQHRGFHDPVAPADVEAFRRVEAAVPPDDGIVVPAEHANVGDFEHWVVPIGPTAAVLPYGARRHLFDVHLGASYLLSWHDLEERLCSPDPEVRTRFLQAHRARWIIVRAPGAADATAAARGQPLCGATVESFGVDPVPVRAERDIYLFRLAATRSTRSSD